jgi:hypothetical protein
VFRDESERAAVRAVVGARGKMGKRIWGMEEFVKWYDARGKRGWTSSSTEASQSDQRLAFEA